MYSRASNRKLLETPTPIDANYTLINMSGCLLVFFNQINFTVQGKTWQLPRLSEDDIGEDSYCEDNDNQTAVYDIFV